MAPLVSAVGLGFSYDRMVLEGFDLQVEAGSLTTIVGLNGAGKTTALRLLSGQLVPGEGRVRIDGGDPQKARVRRRLYYLAEETDAPLHLTGREAVRFFASLYGARCGRGAADTLLDRVGLRRVARKRASGFSKGMRRRLELACLLAADVPVWLLDEPQNGLDPEGLQLLREICREACKEGRAVIMATHDLQDVQALADGVVVLREGKVVFAGGRQDLLERTGTRSFVVTGGGADLDAALEELARARGGEISGPEIAPLGLERLITGGLDSEQDS